MSESTTIREQAQNADAGHAFEPPPLVGPKQLSLNVGGRSPDVGYVVITQYEAPMEGAYDQDGELVGFIVWARKKKTVFDDMMDRAGTVTQRKRIDQFRPVSIREIPEGVLEQLGIEKPE